jgi:DNA-binding LytR/AlgR family response regulator
MRKYFIVEKDVKTSNYIRTKVDSFGDMIFFGSSKKQEEALNLIFRHSPDIIFLDVDNTIINLLDFLLDINQHSKNEPALIALSSSRDFAYNAYQYDFFDYLLKPLTEFVLRKSILRYEKKHPSKSYEKICLKSNKDYQYLNVDEIIFLKADNNTTDFYLKDGSIIGAYKTLKIFENTLPLNFLRIHKSYIINSNYISRIHYGKGICSIKKTSYKIPFSKTFIQNINFINKGLVEESFITLN